MISTKEAILNEIKTLISNSFNTPEEAFAFFDNDKDGKLSKKEIAELLKRADISGPIRGLVTSKLIDGYHKNGTDWLIGKSLRLPLMKLRNKR